MMNGRRVTVEIEYSNDAVTFRKGLSAKEAADIVERLEGESGVTMQISQENIDESLKVAIDCAWAFLGVERPGEVLQYVSDADAGEILKTQPFVIGHQEVDMESKYTMPLAMAAKIVEEWLTKGEASSFGYWEPQ